MQNHSYVNKDLYAAVESISLQLTGLTIAVNQLKSLLTPGAPAPEDEFDPLDPANKSGDAKLTERGIEICYRLFDRGENRNRVAVLMDISFTAATHRYQIWQKLGGPNRDKRQLPRKLA